MTSETETMSVSVHKLPAKEQLLPDILNQIARKHKITACPVCRNEVKIYPNKKCSLGHGIVFQYSVEYKEHYLCNQCQVIWELEIFNWTEERADGMVTEEGHHLYLRAYSNCFCRLRAFEFGRVFIEDNPNGHSHLNLYKDCPPPKISAI